MEGVVMKISWHLVLACPLALACSSSGDKADGTSNSTDSTAIATTPLAGKVGGQPWTFVSGQTDAFLSDGEEDYTGVLTSEAATTCGSFPDLSHLLLYLPRKTGTFPLGLNRIATFSIPLGTSDYDNLGATKGRIVIDEVTASSIRGGAFVEYDANNSVNGQFQVAICAD
jgi:hypothetical protein